MRSRILCAQTSPAVLLLLTSLFWPGREVSLQAAGTLVANGGLGGHLTITSHDVRVVINNGVVVTEVAQVFQNHEDRIVEALYTFPVPRGASVASFSMWINGKEMIGEVVEKERARQIYNSYKQTRRDPGLLEQVDYKRFEMRIFPIAAKAQQKVRLVYYQELEYDHDSATYLYPLATVATSGATAKTTGRFSFTADVRSETPIVSLASPSHGDALAILKRDQERYWQASLETKEGDLNRDLVVHYKLARAKTGIDVIASKQPGEDGYLLLTLTAGKELEEKTFGADYVFVLDVSGSMSSGGKLQLSRKAIEAFTGSLDEKDRMEVMVFNNDVASHFKKLVLVNKQNRASLKEFLDSQLARGGTVLRPAMQAAYRYHTSDRPLNVVILSDGMTEQQEQAELLALIKSRPAGTSVFCVGIGNEVNRPLLTQLAEGAGGLAAFFSHDDDFARQAAAFRRKLVRPAATNLQVRIEGVDVYDREPANLSSLFYGQPVRIYARYRGAGQARITWQGDVLGRATSQTTQVVLPSEEPRNPQIERMWAAHRVERLMGELRAGGPQQLLIGQIIELCEGYSIAGEYASFIVLENNEEYKRWSIQRRNAVRFSRDQETINALRGRLSELRKEPSSQAGPPGEGDQVASRPASNDPAPVPQTLTIPPPAQGPMNDPPGPTSPEVGRGRGGGGALDPFSAAAAAALAAAGWAAYRRMQEGDDAPKA